MTPSVPDTARSLLRKLAEFRCGASPRAARYRELGIERVRRQLERDPWEVVRGAGLAGAALRRYLTALVADFAYGFRVLGSPWEGDRELGERAVEWLMAFVETTREDGCIRLISPVFGNLANPKEWDRRLDSHENYWNAEPLLYGALWLDPLLDDGQREAVRQFAVRVTGGIDWSTTLEPNNRSVSILAVAALFSVYLDDAETLAKCVTHFRRCAAGCFRGSRGQLLEGPHPDGNYSSVIAMYGYLYWRMTGDSELGELLPQCARWYTWAHDHAGEPLFLAQSSRFAMPPAPLVSRYLPLLEALAPRIPGLVPHIETYLKTAGQWDGISLLKGTLTLCWAELEAEAPDGKPDPQWFRRSSLPDYNPKAGPEFSTGTEGYDGYTYLVREEYATAIGVYGRLDFKGLQCWGYSAEPPVLWAHPYSASCVLAHGLHSASMNVSGVKFRDKIWREGPPAHLLLRTETLWQAYVFTPVSTVVVYFYRSGPREERWVFSPDRCGTPSLNDGALVFPERRGRLWIACAGDGTLETNNRFSAWRAKPRCPASVYAFSDSTFSWREFLEDAAVQVHFSDSSGVYAVSLQPPPDSAVDSVNRSYSGYNLTHSVPFQAEKIA